VFAEELESHGFLRVQIGQRQDQIAFRNSVASGETRRGGTETLRHQLKLRSARPGLSLAKIAADISDEIAEAAGRKAARATAHNMAGADATADVVDRLARQLYGTLPPVQINRVTENQLQAFIDGKDLDPPIKTEIAKQLHGGHQIFDAAIDALVPAHQQPPQTISLILPQFVNPNEKIAKAQAALKAALQT
jgi:nitrogen fixation protein